MLAVCRVISFAASWWPWGRGARVEVSRVWCVGGVVPMAAGREWVLVPSLQHVLLLRCLLPGLQEGQGLQIELLFILGGVPWGRGARVEVRRVLCVGGVSGVLVFSSGSASCGNSGQMPSSQRDLP